MNQVLFLIFIVSIILLAVVLLKNKTVIKALALFMLNTLIAAVLLYVLNAFDVLGTYFIPINLFSILTVSLLGIPGLLLLFSIKFFLVA